MYWFDILLCVLGAVVLRPIIQDDGRYFLACGFYGFCLALGKAVFKYLDEE